MTITTVANAELREKNHRIDTEIGILRDKTYPLRPETVIVDLGCGNGDLVQEFRKRGYQVFGCDFVFKEGPHVFTLASQNIIRLIDSQPYRLPFDDGTVDVVVSDQVFEHVQDYSTTLAEIKRILKPDGVSLHIFPSRYTPIEPHVFVPFATIFQNYWWLFFWACVGIRNGSQRGLSARETAERNADYLSNRTNYLTKAKIREHFQQFFSGVSFCEGSFLKLSRRARLLHALSPLFPFLPALYSALRMRIIFCRNGLNN